ncbi:MAG: class I tRNA ligase family protein [Erysipelotrichales bacterium]|nr:class I tRNA ligase family protein [Erysipelotrichales bacterium]
MNYNFSETEKRISDFWRKNHVFRTLKDRFRPKALLIGLDSNPYFWVITDLLARKLRMDGYNVFVSLPSYPNIDLGFSFDYEKINIDFDYKKQFSGLIKNVHTVSFFQENISIREEFRQLIDDLNIDSEENFLLKKEQGYLIKLSFQDLFLGCDIFMNDCANLFGATFVKMSINIKDFKNYCSEDELTTIKQFLRNDQELTCFSGNYIINPLNKYKMPVFFVKNQKEDFQIGIPGLIEDDFIFASRNDLDIIKIKKNNLFVNSDFVNGLDLNHANQLVFDKLTTQGVINLEERSVSDHLFKNYLSFNQEKLIKALIFFCQVLKDHFVNMDFNNSDSKDELNDWLKNCYVFANNKQAEDINYLLLANIVLEKQNIIKERIKSLCVINYKTSAKDIMSLDVWRLSVLLNTEEDDSIWQLIYDIYKLAFINIVSETAELKGNIDFLITKTKDIYEKHNFRLFFDIVRAFVSEALRLKQIGHHQLLKFLKFIHPILPFISEELYIVKINGNTTISYESFPTL